MLLAKANHQAQFGHPSRMPLAEANHQSQPGHPANQQSQPGHPSRMPLAEANQQSQSTFHNRFDIRQQPNFITAQLTSHSRFIIHHNIIIHPPKQVISEH